MTVSENGQSVGRGLGAPRRPSATALAFLDEDGITYVIVAFRAAAPPPQ